MTGSIVLGQRFSSQAELLAAIKSYSQEQGVPYTKFNSVTAEKYNSNARPDKQMPVEQEYKEQIFTCKHYGKPRQSDHKPGTKRRGNQGTFKKFCIAKVNINYNIIEKKHIVSKLEENHCNHAIDKKFVKHYPENRRASSKTVEKVNFLFDNEAKPHRIRDVILDSGVLATGQDIQNLRNKWSASFKGGKKGSVEDALFQELKKLKEEDPNGVVVIHFDKDSNIIHSIFFQTSYMRECLEQYPEVLLMDATYKICDNEMPLIVFEVVDCFGFGRTAGYSIVVSESKAIVSAALQVLKMGCEKLADQVKVVQVDKSQAEIGSIKEVFPNAEIHLCDFHVKETFKRNNVKKLVTENWEEIHQLVKDLIHAHTKEDYDKSYEKLDKVAGGKDSDFMKYFNKNWHNSGLVWSEYQRNQSFTLGERTTGRVESHNQKAKFVIDRKLPVPETILRLRVMNRNASIEHSQRVFNEMAKTKYHKYSSDPVVQQILRVNTPFVGKFLRAQYERSLEPPSESAHEVTADTCDCKYFIQSRLICSHIFRERRENGLEVYDHKLIPPRWTVILPSGEAQEAFNQFEIITSPIKASKSKKTMCLEERYNLAESIGKRISSLVANFGGSEFHHLINSLQNFEDLLRMGKRVAVVGVDGEGQPDLKNLNQADKVILEENDVSGEGSDVNHQGVVTDKTILVSEGIGLESSTVLTQNDEKILKLPVKCPVPGRPKGKRHTAKSTQESRTSGHEEDVDDPGNVSECASCNGPIIRRTSCSKKTQGRKFVICKTQTLPACKNFHAWIMDDESEPHDISENIEKQQPNCIVCAMSGPPSVNGGHKCNKCGDPVHAIDNAPCCSIATNPNEEGFGGKGRTCLKCMAVPPGKICAKGNQSQVSFCSLQSVNARNAVDDDDGEYFTSIKPEPKILPSIEFIDLTEDDDSRISLEDTESAISDNDIRPSTKNFHGHISPVPSPVPSSEQVIISTPSSPDRNAENVEVPGESPTKICFGCKETAVLRTSTQPRSFGQKFHTCPNPVTPKCRWMNWVKWVRRPDSPKISNFFRKPASSDKEFASLLQDSNDILESPSVQKFISDLEVANSARPSPILGAGALRGRPVKRLFPSSRTQTGRMTGLSGLSSTPDPSGHSTCAVCEGNLQAAHEVKCQLCGDKVHQDTKCSLPDTLSMRDGAAVESVRVCRNCLCKTCRHPDRNGHSCVCVVCNIAGSQEKKQCCNCKQAVHLLCFSDIEGWCKLCYHNSQSNVALQDISNVLSEDMLKDTVIVKAMELLHEQFPNIDGLQNPIPAECFLKPWRSNHDTQHSYAPSRKDRPYIQILNTGYEHWITCYKRKGGDDEIHVLNSTGSTYIGSFVEQQLALIMQITEDSSFTVEHNLVKNQQENTNECGPLAIAFATELAFENKISFVNFDLENLRSHLLKCFIERKFTPFPRIGSASASKKMSTESVEVVCLCRLPLHFDQNVIKCSKCKLWCHYKCHNLVSTPTTRRWLCDNCTN